MEYAKKTFFGYKTVNPEESDAKYIILPKKEYEACQEAISAAEQQVTDTIVECRHVKRRLISEHQRECDKMKRQYQDVINRGYAGLQERDNLIEELNTTVRNHEEIINRLEGQMQNVSRISRERANAARGITPKKEHDGYIVMDTRQWTEQYTVKRAEKGYEDRTEEWLEKNGRYVTERKSATTWKSVIQTPYDCCLTAKDVESLIYSDLQGGTILQDLGVEHMLNPDQLGAYENVVLENDTVCILYRIEYHANLRNGFWEIDVYTTEALEIPVNRTICKGKK